MADAVAIKLSTLWCGQGMANVLETFASDQDLKDGKPSSLALIDFGRVSSDRKGDEEKGNSKRNYAVEYVLERVKKKEVKKIEYVIISHSDGDHWSHLAALLDELNKYRRDSLPPGSTKMPGNPVGHFITGGFLWPQKKFKKTVAKAFDKGDHFESIGYIGKLLGKSVNLETGYSDYSEPGNLGYLATLDGVKLRTLITNVATGSNVINTSSLVVVVDFNNMRMILTGDATVKTLHQSNIELRKWGEANPIQPVMMMTVPHHGSISTMKEDDQQPTNGGKTRKRKREEEVEEEVEEEEEEEPEEEAMVAKLDTLEEFTNLTRPAAIVASANRGQGPSGEHPRKAILDALGKYTTKEYVDENINPTIGYNHQIIAYNKNAKEPWKAYEINLKENDYANIFTTRIKTGNSVGEISEPAHKRRKKEEEKEEEQEDKMVDSSNDVSNYFFTITKDGFTQDHQPFKVGLRKLIEVVVIAPWAFTVKKPKDEEMQEAEPASPPPKEPEVPGEPMEPEATVRLQPPTRRRLLAGADPYLPLNPIAAISSGHAPARGALPPIRRVRPIQHHPSPSKP